MANYLLDTTVLIDYLRGNWGVVELVNGLARSGHNPPRVWLDRGA